ncbi:MAG: diaminopimelate epimerase [Gammaproteobacteria bacterium]
MKLKFTKMEGTGNDFVVIDTREQAIKLNVENIRFLADRRLGIGCDQLLVVALPKNADNAISYRIYNADGQEVQQCGNGARALGAYIGREHPLDTRIGMESMSGVVYARALPDGAVSVNMGVPSFEPALLPFTAPALATEYVLDIGPQSIAFGAVSMGNPHAVIPVNNVDEADVNGLGAAFQAHPAFPESVNVGFMQILNRQEMKLRVFERGVGETLACGTGACAAAAIAQSLGMTDSKVMIHAPGGDLLVSWAGEGQNAYLSGACNLVYEGTIIL